MAITRGQIPFASNSALRQINHASQNIHDLNLMQGGDGLTTMNMGRNRLTYTQQPQAFSQSFWGMIMRQGPLIEGYQYPDFTDSRYWVQSIFLNQAESDYYAAQVAKLDVATSLANPTLDGSNLAQFLVATNIAETATGTHSMPVGTLVFVTVMWGMIASSSFPAFRQAVFSSAGPPVPQAKIISVSGSFPQWTYTMGFVSGYSSASNILGAEFLTTGSTFTAINTIETVPSGYPYTHGTGVTVTASDGTVNGGSCKILPLGPGGVYPITKYADQNQSGATVFTFTALNSAG